MQIHLYFKLYDLKKFPIEEWEGKKIDEKSMITKRADILFDVGKFNKSVVCYTAALNSIQTMFIS